MLRMNALYILERTVRSAPQCLWDKALIMDSLRWTFVRMWEIWEDQRNLGASKIIPKYLYWLTKGMGVLSTLIVGVVNCLRENKRPLVLKRFS